MPEGGLRRRLHLHLVVGSFILVFGRAANKAKTPLATIVYIRDRVTVVLLRLWKLRTPSRFYAAYPDKLSCRHVAGSGQGVSPMHIILGFLGSLVTLFYLLDRLGIDIGGMNPFYWYRRRAFAKKYGSDPIFSVEDPVHIAALLVIGTAKLGGDLTAEQKAVAQAEFESQFSLDSRDASQLFGSAAHLLAAPQLLDTQLQKLADRNTGRFSAEQAASLLQMTNKVAASGGEPTALQMEFIERLQAKLVPEQKGEGTWA